MRDNQRVRKIVTTGSMRAIAKTRQKHLELLRRTQITEEGVRPHFS